MPRRALMGRFLRQRSRFDKPVPTAKLAEKTAERQERRRKAKAMAESAKIAPEAAPFGPADMTLMQIRADQRRARESEGE